jgi:hypothetical protein
MNHEDFESAILVSTFVQVTETRTHHASLERRNYSKTLLLRGDP